MATTSPASDWSGLASELLGEVYMGLYERFSFLKRKIWARKMCPFAPSLSANYAEVIAGVEAATIHP